MCSLYISSTQRPCLLLPPTLTASNSTTSLSHSTQATSLQVSHPRALQPFQPEHSKYRLHSSTLRLHKLQPRCPTCSQTTAVLAAVAVAMAAVAADPTRGTRTFFLSGLVTLQRTTRAVNRPLRPPTIRHTRTPRQVRPNSSLEFISNRLTVSGYSAQSPYPPTATSSQWPSQNPTQGMN